MEEPAVKARMAADFHSAMATNFHSTTLQLMEEPAVKELMATRNDGSPFAARQSTRERVADSTTTIQKV